VGRLPGAPGIYVAVTHSGVTLAAHLSRLITADLTTGTPPPALAPYHPGRFPAAPHLAVFLYRTSHRPAPVPVPRHPAPMPQHAHGHGPVHGIVKLVGQPGAPMS
jgi:hypothetical protein